jgi:hypothetical protein
MPVSLGRGMVFCVTAVRLSLSLLLGACTANAASPAPGSPGATLPCEPSKGGAVECLEVLRIAARPSDVGDDDERLELVLHAWEHDDGRFDDVAASWVRTRGGREVPVRSDELRPGLGVSTARIGVDAWRVMLVDGTAAREFVVTHDDDGEAAAFATVVTGDPEPTRCRMLTARLRRRTALGLSFGLGGLEARCEDDDGTEVHGMVALASVRLP